jgi:predicted nucleic acid-binding protein
MIVVADASPVCYLILIGEIEVLPKLFTQLWLPREVLDELLDDGAPPSVRTWANAPPPWISIRATPENAWRSTDNSMNRLHSGERAAILLAESIRSALIILDEKSARRVAAERGLRVTGLLGVLVEAANRGFLDLAAAINRLTKTNFRYSPGLLKSAWGRYHR